MLIGIDESEGSLKAAKRVIEIQKDYEGKIIAFHSILHRKSDSDAKDVEEHGKKVFTEIEKLFKEASLSIETRLIVDVEPEDYIKNIVEKENINLVVLGYSGKHGILKRRLIGSIPTQVMNNVLCDVLIVK
ncbi:MAG: universal stress protein [Candidatus Hodarchaeota archaeon]